MYNRGLVALSGDPIHYGHFHLIQEAKKKCHKLFLLVSNNDLKKGKYTFTLAERTEMARRLTESLEDVEVIQPPTDVLADTYLRYNCDAIFRGIRNEADYQFEKSQMELHKLVYSKFNPEFIESQGEYKIISSTLIKAFVSHHIDTAPFIPVFIKKALEERINKQYKIAVTGCMASGKSWVCDRLVDILNFKLEVSAGKIDPGCMYEPTVKSIKIDELIRSIYEDPIPGAVAMRREIQRLVHLVSEKIVLDSEGQINRKALGDFMFSNECSQFLRGQIQDVTLPLIHMKYREALAGHEGLVIVEWAQLAEMSMENWTNHNVIVVDSPDRKKLIEKRKLTPEQVQGRGQYQWSTEEKVRKLTEVAQKAGGGHIIEFSNTLKNNKIDSLADEVMNHFGLEKTA